MNILTWIEALKGGAIGLETDRASPTRAEKNRAGPGGPNAHPWFKPLFRNPKIKKKLIFEFEN